MTTRNFNNVTTIGQLAAPLASSATSVATSGFTNYPTAPFTATIDRNTVTEEIVLVTAVVGGTLTMTRGYDGTAAIAHAAGATIEHTAGAIEYQEANAHTNATSDVHGVSGALVGAEGAQSIFDKTLVSPVVQADVTAGDAVVAYDPTGVRNLFRGMDSNGDDVIVVDGTGAIQAESLTAVGGVTAAGAVAANGGITVPAGKTGTFSGGLSTTQVTSSGPVSGTTGTFTGTVAANGGITVPTGKTVAITDAPTAGTSAANKAYVDGKTWPTSALSDAASAATPSVAVKRDAAGRAQVADPSAAADIATKNYVDGKLAGIAPTKIISGTGTIPTTAGQTDAFLAVSFGTTFASAPGVLISLNGSSSDFWWLAWARNVTTTGFQAFIRYTNGTSPTSAAVTFTWVALA